MTIVKPRDVVSAGFCIAGLRRAYPQYGLTREQFQTFLRDGLNADFLSGIDDVMVQRTIACAVAREEKEQALE